MDRSDQAQLQDYKAMLFLLNAELPENRKAKAVELVGEAGALALLAVFSGRLTASWCDGCHEEVWFSDLSKAEVERSRLPYFCNACLDKAVLMECYSPGPGIYHRH